LITTDGRLLFAALHLLLGADRLFNLAPERRLPAILAESRRYQNTVSTQLAAQVLAALYELLRGFQAADAQTGGALLGKLAHRDPDTIYGGLLTVLLRLIFILYAEDRGLISTDPLYVNHYAVSGLFQRLQADAGRYPDTMDSRYGAWAQLLARRCSKGMSQPTGEGPCNSPSKSTTIWPTAYKLRPTMPVSHPPNGLPG